MLRNEGTYEPTVDAGGSALTFDIELPENCAAVGVAFTADETPASNTKAELLQVSSGQSIAAVVETLIDGAGTSGNGSSNANGKLTSLGPCANTLRLTYHYHATNDTTFKFHIIYVLAE